MSTVTKEVFVLTTKRLMDAAAQFTRDIHPSMDTIDVARVFLATGGWLAAGAVGREPAAEMLRALADGLERGDDLQTLN